MGKPIDESGSVYGRLTVLERAENHPGDRRAKWRCICACGREAIVRGACLRAGQKSCGCAAIDHARALGESGAGGHARAAALTPAERSAAASKAGKALIAKRGSPWRHLTSEQRAKGQATRIERYGPTGWNLTPQQLYEVRLKAGYAAGRAHLGRAIERKRALIAELEAELSALGVSL